MAIAATRSVSRRGGHRGEEQAKDGQEGEDKSHRGQTSRLDAAVM